MRYLMQGLIFLYQKFISPLFPKSCRFYPTCSNYAMECYKRFGFIKGTVLTVRRILRCNPFCKGGIDYVPEKFSFGDLFCFKRKK